MLPSVPGGRSNARGAECNHANPFRKAGADSVAWSGPHFSLVGSDPTHPPWCRVPLLGIGTVLGAGAWALSILRALCCCMERDAWESLLTASGIQLILGDLPTPLLVGRLGTEVCSQQRWCRAVHSFRMGWVWGVCVLVLQKPCLRD